jgi:sugar lactone lactonase YvrE
MTVDDARSELAPRWQMLGRTPARPIGGANGLRIGPDGALYNASAFGNQVSRIDPDTGAVTVVSARGSAIVSPDDLAFDSDGVLYVAECMDARVTALRDGVYTVIADDVLGANGITVFEDRIFVGQFIPGGSILEVYRDDRPARLVAAGLDGPNGLTIGPDRLLYTALPFAGAVARVSIDGGEVETVLEGLAAPCSCRTGPDGRIYVGLGGSGEVVAFDPATSVIESVGHGRPGMDNLDLTADGRLFASYYIDGAVYELLPDGGSREIVAPGLMAPYGLAATTAGLCVADGLGAARITADLTLERTDKITDPGFPGYVRGLCASPDRTAMFVTNNLGMVTRHAAGAWTAFETWAEGLGEVTGVAARSDGVVVADSGGGRVLGLPRAGETLELATGLGRPSDVAVTADDRIYVSDEARGTVELIGPDSTRTVFADDLRIPQGVAVDGDGLLVCEVGRRRVVWLPFDGGGRHVVADDLPVGENGTVRPTVNGLPMMIPGPIAPFAGVEVDEQGTVYVAADQEGSVIALRRA